MTAKNIKFSIILPTYNRARCITDAIDSVLKQTFKNFELIIIDDGSTDGTGEIIKNKYSKQIAKKQIRYIKAKKQGVCKARNRGLAAAKNPWIAYIDSDNVVHSDFLKTFANAISKNDNQLFYAQLQKRISGGIVGYNFDREYLLYGNYIDLGVFVHHKNLYKKLGGFDESLKRLVDWDLIIRYTRDYTPMFIEKVLLDYDDSDGDRITKMEKNNAKAIRKKHKEKSKFFEIKKFSNRRCHVRLCGLKIMSYNQ